MTGSKEFVACHLVVGLAGGSPALLLGSRTCMAVGVHGVGLFVHERPSCSNVRRQLHGGSGVGMFAFFFEGSQR